MKVCINVSPVPGLVEITCAYPSVWCGLIPLFTKLSWSLVYY